ncbi:hypothetical protein ARMGADRAFT_1030018 [Armillaria gallica]|uniref:Uncharacterized protein n=1 Tax=Armillaria gallica TaxID=47427 RepID=A0A2H3DPG7_ARMGA|nr:hypothetical protein ARMGADRAFT_1030018 [Armillaria gallica]
MNDTGTKMMRFRRENMAAMTTQRRMEPTNLHLSLATAFYTPSRASSVIPSYGDEQLTTTVHLHRHDISSPDASYEGYWSSRGRVTESGFQLPKSRRGYAIEVCEPLKSEMWFSGPDMRIQRERHG